MQILKAYKTELNPTEEQKTILIAYVEAVKWVYNWGLQERIKEYDAIGKCSSVYEQIKQITKLKKLENLNWLDSIMVCSWQMALINLGKAYRRFHKETKENKKAGIKKRAGFPKFKKMDNNNGSFYLRGNIFSYNGCVSLLRIGKIELKEKEYIPENIVFKMATISEKMGRWYISAIIETEIEDRKATGEPIGIDLGIKTLATCSDGRTFGNYSIYKPYIVRIKKLDHQLSNQIKGSRNYQKTLEKLLKTRIRMANIRNEIIQRSASEIVATYKLDNERPKTIVLENLNINKMMKNRRMAQRVKDSGMYEFRRVLEYKARWYGIKILIADKYFPSSKTCHNCKKINKSLKLTDREWACDSCGMHHERDLNAAINLKMLAMDGFAKSYA